MTRKLATIRKISEIKPIEGADAIEVATVDGWKVVVKKGEFKVDDLVVFCEIDSWIPHELASFLSNGKEPRVYNGVKGERLRTVRLRGQLSQGLVLPIKDLYGKLLGLNNHFDGQDVTENLGIVKWECPMPAQLSGTAKGNFPGDIPKTDQERIQNIKKQTFLLDIWEVSEKLEGSSMTCYLIEGVFGVCSRNLDLERDEENSFWKVAIKQDIENKMRSTGMDNFAIQGELIGPGVQGNIYKLDELDFYIYDIYNIKGNEKITSKNASYLDAHVRSMLLESMGLKSVPILESRFLITEQTTKEDILSLAEGDSKLFKTKREGIVFKSLTDPNKSFKAINNQYLLSEK